MEEGVTDRTLAVSYVMFSVLTALPRLDDERARKINASVLIL